VRFYNAVSAILWYPNATFFKTQIRLLSSILVCIFWLRIPQWSGSQLI